MKDNVKDKRGGKCSMKKRLNRIKALVLAMAMLVSVFQGVPGVQIFDWSKKAEAADFSGFINDARWKNGGAWGYNQKPKLSNWSSIGCCAYVADFAAYNYGKTGDFRGNYYDNIAEMRAGDIIHVENHWFVCLGRNGNSLYSAEGNVDGKVVVSNSRYTISGNNIVHYLKQGPKANQFLYGYHYGEPVIVNHDAEGYLDSVTASPGQIHVKGWALDRDNTSKQLMVHVYIGNASYAIPANTYRDDVDRKLGGVGAWHGFDAVINTDITGTQQVRAYAIGIDKNGNGDNRNPQLNNVHTTNIPPKIIYNVNTGGASDRKNREAKISGSLSPAGTANSWGFYIGTEANKMTRCTVSAGATASDQMNAFVSKYYRLSAGTTYYYQVWAHVNDQEKKGEVKSFTTTAAKPDIPTLKVDANSKDIGIGDAPSVTWNAVDQADYYKLYLYDGDGKLVQEADKVEGTKYAFIEVPTDGKYSATVEAWNECGSKGDSNVVTINVHPDVTVTFMDADSFVDVGEDYTPAVLGERQVHWGKSAEVPSDPKHTGYTFKKWDGVYKNVKEDVTIKAVYEINQYTVKFVDSTTSEVIGTEKVDYYSSAHPVEYDIPDGYAKAGYDGWDKDYTHITDNVMLFSCIGWYNENFPIFARITSAVREYDAEESDNEGYTIVTKLINNEESTTKGRVVVALKTKEGKLLTTTESSAFSIKKGTEKEVEVFVPYDKAASIAEVYVVGQYKAAVPITTTASNNAMMEIDQSSTYSNWSTEEPPADAPNQETRTEYRYKDKTTITSYDTSVAGYTQEGSRWVQSGSGNIDYVASFPSGFNTGNWYYQAYNRSPVGAYENATNKRTVSTSTIAYLYWHWCRGTYTAGPINRKVSDCWTSEFSTFHAYTGGALGYDGAAGAFYGPNAGQCKDTYWWLATGCWNGNQLPVQRCSYTDYRKLFTYSKWSDFSDWSTTKVTGSNTRQVEERVVHRYQAAEDLVEDNSGEERTIKGTLGAEFAGKEASLFIYKVDEASDYTNEYVAQTVLDEEGNYEFTFKLREEPSVKTGDYTVTLGVEGTSTAIYLDTIEAPRKEYTVNFYDYNGKLISTEKVLDGDNAALPDESLLVREGYTFTKWTDTNVNITEDKDIYAEYKINNYHVVFVDWGANTVQVKQFEYGAQLVAPIAEEADEGVTVEWDAIADGNTIVTTDMVVCTRYSKKTCNVTIMGFDNNVISSGTVEYGQAALLPAIEAGDDRIFLGWKDISEGDDRGVTDTIITKNVILCPEFVYKDTVAKPSADIKTGEYDKAQTVTLTCDTEDVDIYYTLDGSNPKGYGATLYTEPIEIDDAIELQFYACKSGMNDSDIAREVYAVNYEDARSKWLSIDELPAEVQNNMSEYDLYTEVGYRYKDIKEVTKLDEASAMENSGWSITDEEKYTEYSEWSEDLPYDDGTSIGIDVDSRPVYTSQYQYKYSHYVYTDGTATAYSATEPEGIESVYEETDAFAKPLAIAGFDSDKKPYYVYDGQTWYSQNKITGQVQTGTEYRWRNKIATYYKWTGYSIDEPAGDESRDYEEDTVYSYIRHNKYIVTVHVGDKEYTTLVEEGGKVDIADYCNVEGYNMDGIYTDSEYANMWDLENDVVTSGMELYVKQNKKYYSVIFYDNDNNKLDEQSVGYGEAAVAPDMPEIDGYIFVGWNSDEYTNVKTDLMLVPVYIPEDEYATVALDNDNVKLYVGRSTELTAIVTPRSQIGTELEWTSSDERVAKVSSTGKVTGIGEGTADITVKVVRTGETATCKVEIKVDAETDLSLLKNSELTIDKFGFLRGIKADTAVSKVLNEFNNDNLLCKDMNGNILAEEDKIGTGSTIYLMSGSKIMDSIMVVVAGDIDGDGLLSNRDVSRLARMLLDKEVPSEVQILAGDVNGDGEIGNKDVSMISRAKLGKITL